METVDKCFPSDPIGELCIKGHFVFHETVQPDGGTQTTNNYDYCVSITAFGEVILEECEKGHETSITREGEPQQVEVVHVTGESTFMGRTCTYDVRYVRANGELRAEKTDSECN